jgi:hypothetical protein
MKKSWQFAKFLVIALVFSLLFFSQNAIAAMGISSVDSIFKSVPITGGNFAVDITIPVENKARIGKAIVYLPEGETGTIDEIAITGPNGKIFGCQNIPIKNGTDLIKTCGGPAYLVVGDTNYKASGSNFRPLSDVKFTVELFPN